MLLALAWLCKWWLKKQSAKEIETFKGGLQEKLAGVTAELGRISKRQEIEFSWLHTKRAAITAELYSKLVTTIYSINSIAQNPNFKLGYNDTKFEVHLKELRLEANRKTLDLYKFIAVNKIYFSESLFEQLKTIRSINMQRLTLATFEIDNERADETFTQLDDLENKSQAALTTIETLFKQLLQVDDKTGS